MEEGLGESTASLRTPSAIKKLVSLQEMCIIGIGQTGWAEKNEDVSTKRYSSDPSNSFPSQLIINHSHCVTDRCTLATTPTLTPFPLFNDFFLVEKESYTSITSFLLINST